jgi:hypothetical protein
MLKGLCGCTIYLYYVLLFCIIFKIINIKKNCFLNYIFKIKLKKV